MNLSAEGANMQHGSAAACMAYRHKMTAMHVPQKSMHQLHHSADLRI